MAKGFNAKTRLRNENSIEDVLKVFIKGNKLEAGINNIDVREAWKNLLGPGIASYTADIILKKDVLYVALTSPVVREELSYGKEKIIGMINEEVGRDVVKDLILR